MSDESCICRQRIYIIASPIQQLAWADDLLKAERHFCHHEAHSMLCVAKAKDLITMARHSLHDGLMELGVTLRDNVSPVLVAGLEKPWGADPPSFEWMQRGLAEIVGDKDGTTQVLEDVMQDIAEDLPDALRKFRG